MITSYEMPTSTTNNHGIMDFLHLALHVEKGERQETKTIYFLQDKYFYLVEIGIGRKLITLSHKEIHS